MLYTAVGVRQMIYFGVILYAACLLVAEDNNPAHSNGERELDIEPFVAVRSRRGDDDDGIPPWLGSIHDTQIKYTRYSKDENDAKRHKINSPPNVVASKRTIKIGQHVCGSVDDANEFERNWKKKKINATVSNVKEVHKCCWRHNRCPRTVPAKVARYGFKNDMEYDIMSCRCDNIFKKCLKDGKSYTADAIGHLYFDTLKIPCLTFTQTSQMRHEADYVSVVPDLVVEHPRIGAAKVAVNLDSKRSEQLKQPAMSAALVHDAKEKIIQAAPYKKSTTVINE